MPFEAPRVGSTAAADNLRASLLVAGRDPSALDAIPVLRSKEDVSVLTERGAAARSSALSVAERKLSFDRLGAESEASELVLLETDSGI